MIYPRKHQRKPFYMKMAHNVFKKGDILQLSNTSMARLVVLNPSCKDPWWKKVLRYFGFKIINRTGELKVKHI